MAFTEKVGIKDYANAEIRAKSKERIEEIRAARDNNNKGQRGSGQSKDEAPDSNTDSGSG